MVETRVAALVAACGLLVLAGCGEEGVAEGAEVSVYVSASLCPEAKRELARVGGRVGDLRLRAVCVDDAGGSGDSRLAAIGAAARQTTEDSSSVAYIGTDDQLAIRFSEPILEEAGIARISASAGKAAITRLLRALERAADEDSPREALFEELQ